MAAFTQEFARLFNGEILSKEERRALSTTVIARVVIMAAVLLLFYAVLPIHDQAITTRALLSAATALLSSHFALTFSRLNNNIRAAALLIGIFVAGMFSEVQLCIVFFDRSSLFLAIPAVIAPVILPAPTVFICWLIVQALAVTVAVTGHCQFNVFNSVMLLVLSIVVWLVSARADRVIDILAEQKRAAEEARDEAETAIGIIVTAEEMRLEDPLWPKKTARKGMAERYRT